jgi:hypothetical protein
MCCMSSVQTRNHPPPGSPATSSNSQSGFVEYIDGLPSSHGFSVIMVVVDCFSKYGHFIALSHPYTASKVA